MKTIDNLDRTLSLMLNVKDVVWPYVISKLLKGMRNVERNRYRGLVDHIHSHIRKMYRQGGQGDEQGAS